MDKDKTLPEGDLFNASHEPSSQDEAVISVELLSLIGQSFDDALTETDADETVHNFYQLYEMNSRQSNTNDDDQDENKEATSPLPPHHPHLISSSPRDAHSSNNLANPSNPHQSSQLNNGLNDTQNHVEISEHESDDNVVTEMHHPQPLITSSSGTHLPTP